MKKYVVTLAITGVLLTGVSPSLARAETTSSTSLEALMKQIEELQKQIKALKGEVETLRSGLKEGSSNDDVKKIQELLATDPSIYPGGFMTGFFGPMTKEAVKRFQEKHGLTVTGEIDEATKKLMQEYFKERQNGRFPEGLLKKDGIRELMKNRMGEKPKFEIKNIRLVCKDKKNLDCPIKIKDSDDDDTDEDDDNDDGVRHNRGQFASSSAITADIAENMIDDAEAAVEDLREAVDGADTSKERAQAKAKLRQVESLLRTAKNHLTAKRYVPAYNNANQAEDKSLDALDDLDGDDEDDEEDDEDEDDEEDDEDEDEDEDEDD